MLGHSFEAMVLLAEAYEMLGRYHEAYEIYEDLQGRDASHIYLEKQVFLLFKLGRGDEAEKLHAFGYDVTDYHKKTLRPLSYYR
jgi:hypothetical protein